MTPSPPSAQSSSAMACVQRVCRCSRGHRRPRPVPPPHHPPALPPPATPHRLCARALCARRGPPSYPTHALAIAPADKDVGGPYTISPCTPSSSQLTTPPSRAVRAPPLRTRTPRCRCPCSRSPSLPVGVRHPPRLHVHPLPPPSPPSSPSRPLSSPLSSGPPPLPARLHVHPPPRPALAALLPLPPALPSSLERPFSHDAATPPSSPPSHPAPRAAPSPPARRLRWQPDGVHRPRRSRERAYLVVLDVPRAPPSLSALIDPPTQNRM
ncbi:hypothetical protein C8R44DRAFT_978524 [Mycena epipterygia]|nr:hypothetical protein C8R44DRAFT_978524 [Mycena epipterygia]